MDTIYFIEFLFFLNKFILKGTQRQSNRIPTNYRFVDIPNKIILLLLKIILINIINNNNINNIYKYAENPRRDLDIYVLLVGARKLCLTIKKCQKFRGREDSNP
uniref:Uncharacterized protein n=1 Tax=Cacopsylla melanoneura TaxID=428564 RepID=A0A8D8XNA7_9HEMI